MLAFELDSLNPIVSQLCHESIHRMPGIIAEEEYRRQEQDEQWSFNTGFI